jgi:hypothetical protein
MITHLHYYVAVAYVNHAASLVGLSMLLAISEYDRDESIL